MRDGVDEGVLLFIAPDFPDQEDRIDHHSADDEGQKQEAQEKQHPVAPVEQNPADVEQDADQNQARAKRDENRDGLSPAGDHHASSLMRKRNFMQLRARPAHL